MGLRFTKRERSPPSNPASTSSKPVTSRWQTANIATKHDNSGKLGYPSLLEPNSINHSIDNDYALGAGLCDDCAKHDWEYHFNRYWDDRRRQDCNIVQERGEGCKATRHPYPAEYRLNYDSTWLSTKPYSSMLQTSHCCSFCKLIIEAIGAAKWLTDSIPKKQESISDQALQVQICGPCFEKDWPSWPLLMRVTEQDSTPLRSFQSLGKWVEIPIVTYPDAHQVDPSLLRKWWIECRENHGTVCIPADAARSGLQGLGLLRVIDVNEMKVVSVPLDVDYVALSYCWGTAQSYKAARRDFVNGELFLHDKVLPRTVEDAIAFTALVGERFLWVDAVCIAQDDGHELARSVRHMHAIYKATRFTTVSASATSADAGLEGLRPNSRQLKFARSTVMGTTLTELPSPVELVDTPWAKRAWTFQENYFSVRRFIFAAGRVFYTCPTCIRSEHMRPGLDSESLGISVVDSGFLDVGWLDWHAGDLRMPYDIPTEHTTICGSNKLGYTPHTYLENASLYGRRQATYRSDSLNAFAGFLSDLQSGGEDCEKFCWGLPTSWFHVALGWTVFAHLFPGFINAVTQEHLDSFRRDRCRWNQPPDKGDDSKSRSWFPSWSWASCDHFFSYMGPPLDDARPGVTWPWDSDYLLKNAPNPFATGVLRIYVEITTLQVHDVRRQARMPGVFYEGEVVLDDLSFFAEGAMEFIRICDLAINSLEPAVQILGLKEESMVPGVPRFSRRCCLRISLAVWNTAHRQHEVIELV